MPALDTITMKNQLINDWNGSWNRNNFMPGFYESLMRQNALTGTKEQVENEIKFLIKNTTLGLQMSHNYFVSPEMQTLVTAAARAWEPDEPITKEDFPTQQGFLWLPQGLVHLDVRGLPVATSAFLWDIYGNRVTLMLFADKMHKVDRTRELDSPMTPDLTSAEKLRAWKLGDRLSLLHISRTNLDGPVHQLTLAGKPVPPEIADQIQVMPGDNGQVAMFLPEGWSQEDLAPHEQPDPDLSWLVSALRIMQQPLAQVSHPGIPTNVRKALGRSKVKLKNTKMSVIEFRRRSGDFIPGGEGREYSHRFFRRGHWRRQNYKNDQGEWAQKRIWILPTLVGDPSLPILDREKVNAFLR